MQIHNMLQDLLGGTTCLTLRLSNTASFVLYGITRLVQLTKIASLFATFEEHLR